MELQDFIKNTLISIKRGVSEANKDIKKEGSKSLHFMMHGGVDKTGSIHFDVAVSVRSEKNKSGGAGLKIYVVDLGGQGSKKDFQENITRIQFYIRIGTSIA